MSRKKPKTVSTVRHANTGIEIEIKMDMDSLDFSALMPDGSTLSGKEGKALENTVRVWLRENLTLEWHDVIEVKMLSPFSSASNSFVGLDVARFHWAEKIGGQSARYVRAEWGRRPHDTENMFGRSDPCGWRWVKELYFRYEVFSPPCRGDTGHNEGIYYIVYTDELWAGLVKTVETIREIKARLREILDDQEKGHAYLAAIGANLLLALPATVTVKSDE